MKYSIFPHIAIVVFTVSAALATEPIDIGSRLEPMVDNYLIDKLDGTRLVLHPPTPREVSVVHNTPHEGNVCCYHTVFADNGLFRMYYRGAHWDSKTGKSSKEVVCYAESRDGIKWTKPDLGLVEFNGSKKNNIIWDGLGSHDFAPMKDANPEASPDAKYKALARGKGGLYAFKSPDAIHWKLMRNKPVITKGAFDSQNLAFWDPLRKCYVDFHRGFRNGFRDIMTCTSKDFLTWTDPVWLEYPGSAPEHLYTNQIAPYARAPHIYFGFPKRFVPSRKFAEHKHSGVSDGVFMTSRDSRNFHRWGEALIRPGLQPERWVNRNNMTAWGILTTKSALPGAPDELSIYSTEGYYSGDSCQIRRFSSRLDGFVSLQAPGGKGGQMITKPIVFDGKKLVINFSTSAAGSIHVEIQDEKGKPIPGFALADSTEIFGDSVKKTVSWKGGSDLGKLAGKPVRLHFVMKDADLYSIQFEN
ncbi:MAG: hypothetical protein JXM70_23795 [Pirellulales bacterium]|nr:hypothetical protein [Pirellulales bacterium]